MQIFKVTLKASGDVHYFTSIAAIYDTLSADDIGCKVGTLWNKQASRMPRTETKRAVIERLRVSRKAQTNKNKKQ